MILQPRLQCRRLLQYYPCISTFSHFSTSASLLQFAKSSNTNHEDPKASSRLIEPFFWSFLSPSISDDTSKLQIPKAFVPGTLKPERVPCRTPLVVLLVTPAHIGLIESKTTFIPKLLNRSFRNTVSGHEFDVLVGVIDHIPSPDLTRNDGQPIKKIEDFRRVSGQQVEDGYEGITVGVLDSEAAAPDLWTIRTLSKQRETTTIQQRCSISFSFLSVSSKAVCSVSASEGSQRVLQMPVANTLFQNGRTSTLLAQRWRVDKGEGSTAYHCIRETSLPQQTIKVAMPLRIHDLALESSLKTHLIPITKPREVVAAIGNIIRKFSVKEGSNGSAPASENLEQAIRKRMDEGLTPQKVEVWALIQPRSLPNPSEESDTSQPNAFIQREIFRGSRLHKVLSGGGGWGKKQGLLALDPDPDYNPNIEQSSPMDENLTSDSSTSHSVFENLVHEGDIVTFYMNDPPQLTEIDDRSTNTSEERSVNISVPQPLFSFGCVPSKMDAVPSVQSPSRGENDPRPQMMIRNYFGMLSEQGMSLQTIFKKHSLSGMNRALAQADISIPESVNKLSVKTKMDVPYTVFSFGLGPGRRKSVETEIYTDSSIVKSPYRDEAETHQPGHSQSQAAKFGTAIERRKDFTALQARFEASKAASKFSIEEKGRLWRTIADKVKQPESIIRKVRQTQELDKQQTGAHAALPRRQAALDSAVVRKHLVQSNGQYRSTTQGQDSLALKARHEKDSMAEAPAESTESHIGADTRSEDIGQRGNANIFHQIKKGRKSLSSTLEIPLVKKYKLSNNDPRDKAKRKLLSIRKHTSLNPALPFNLAQELHEKGPISAREQAAGLHHQYHLPLRPKADENHSLQ